MTSMPGTTNHWEWTKRNGVRNAITFAVMLKL